MNRIVKTELYKIFNNKSTYIISLFSLLAYYLLAKISGTFDTSGDLTYAIAQSISIMPLFTALIVIPVAQNDLAKGTMKNIVGTGITRRHIYFGKLSSAIIAGILLYFVNIVFASIISVANGYSLKFSIGSLFVTVVSQIIIVIDYTMMFYIFSNLLRSNMSSLIASMIMFLGSNFILSLLERKYNIANAKEFDLAIISGKISNLEYTGDVAVHLVITTIVIAIATSLFVIPFIKKEIK